MITRPLMMAGTAAYDFQYTVNTAATSSSDKKTGLPVNLYGQDGVVIDVDWGDGTTSTLTSASFTASDSTAAVHTYASAGTYTVTATSKNWSDAYLLSVYADATISSNSCNAPVYWWRRTLTGIVNALPPVKGVKGITGASATAYTARDNDLGFLFHRCEKMTSIPASLFANCGHIQIFNSTFYNCIVLPSLPAGLFDPCVSATDFSDCFRYCTALTSIPVSFFKYCTAATNMYNVFRFCNKVPNVPADLFRYNTLVTNMGGAFSKCDALKDFTLCIGSPNVATVTDFIPNASSVTRIVCVPANSTTYTSFNSYKNSSNNVTVSTDNADCGIEEEEIDDGTWRFTVDTEAGQAGERKTGVPVNLYGQTGIELTVDWGDNTTSTLTASDYASNNSSASVHEYAVAGEYTIAISSNDWANTYLYYTNYETSSQSNSTGSLYWFKRTLISVDNAFPAIKGLKKYNGSDEESLYTYLNNFSYFFDDCTNLASISANLFSNNASVTNVSGCFYGCTSLASIPSKLFNKNTAITNFCGCFQDCTSLTTIPSGLFDKNTVATDFSTCFYGCTSLTTIPSGLFDKNTAAVHFDSIFNGCSSLQSIPSGLFDKNTLADSFYMCFSETGISSIPSGLFDKNTAATNFECCFEGCASLTSVPAGLFDKNTAVTSFDSCFSWCTSLAAIPAGLFDKNTAATNFEYCFSNCQPLASIPVGLFDKNTLATNFSSCFNNCTAITSVPFGLFDKNTAATDFSFCFSGCTSLASIPSGLFSKNTAATDFSCCFQVCTSLNNFHLIIGSSIAEDFHNFISPASNVDRIVCVPANSTTYTSITSFADNQNNVVVSTDVMNCAEAWEFTIDTEATASGEKKTGVPFNLANNQSGIQLLIDWGDNTTSRVSPSDYTNSDSTASVHEYATAGEYTVTIYSSDWENTYLFAVSGEIPSITNANSPIYWLKRTLISIDIPLPKIKGANLYTAYYHTTPNYSTNFSYTFDYYAKLSSIPENLFTNNTDARLFYNCFQNCISLISIPSNIFNNKTTEVDHCFWNCTSLTSISSNLFANAVNITSFSECFRGCTSLSSSSISVNLFNNNTKATNFIRCFEGCTSITTIPSGLFDKNTNVTSFASCFYDCSSLASIPAGLFDKNTAVTSFEECFYGCTSLQSIPAGLFDKNTAVTSFRYCFDRCSSLQSIPSKLFDKNTAVTSFSYCFSGCTSLQSIPSGLFDKNTAVTSFSYCFSDCTSLQSIPSKLFDKNTAVTSFYGCFSGCTNLLNFHLKIGSSSVTTFSNFISNASNVDRILCVPANSTTYTNATAFANNSNNVIVSTDFIDCSEAWEFTIDTEATASGEKKTGIPFNLYGQTGVELLVDWGDNTTSRLSPSNYTASDSTASIHEYVTAGEYTVTIASNDWENTYLLIYDYSITTVSNTRTSSLYWFRTTATSIDTKLPQIKGIVYADTRTTYKNSLQYLFCYLVKLTSIPSGLFDNNTAVTTFYSCFLSCSSLQSIPAGLFDNNVAVTSFYNCFSYCSSLQSIPSGLFDNNVAVTTFYGCFSNCTSLASIPLGLFDKNTAVTSFRYCFSYCSSLTSIPAGLFDKNTEVTNFNDCFSNCSSLTSIPAGLFDKNTAVTSFYGCFRNCTSIQSISAGLFYKNTAVTDFSYCFSGCTNLLNFHLKIGSSSVTTFSNFISNASNVDRILCVPANSTTYTNATAFANNSNNVIVSTDFIDCSEAWEFTIDTEATTIGAKKTAVPFYLYGDTGIKILVDWGDNTTSTLTPSNYTQHVSTTSIHTYATAGEYTVTIFSNDWENTYIWSATPSAPSEKVEALNIWRQTLISVNPLPKIKGVKSYVYYNESYAYNDNSVKYLFESCKKLTSIPYNLFMNNSAIRLFEFCFENSALTSIPVGLFDNNTTATHFYGTFERTPITFIPSDLFVNNIAATSFAYCFMYCESLQTIPSDLFVNNIQVTAFNDCFNACFQLTNFTLNITSAIVTAAGNFVTGKSNTTRIINVPANSATYTTFSNLGSYVGLTIVGV